MSEVSTPDRIRALRAFTRAGDIQRLIDTIERALPGSSGACWVAVSLYAPDIVEEVCRRYRAAGWSAECVADQRDGNAIVIKEQP